MANEPKVALFIDPTNNGLYLRNVGDEVEFYQELRPLEYTGQTTTQLGPDAYCASVQEDPVDLAEPGEERPDPLGL